MSHPKCPFNIKLLRRRLSEEKRRHCGGAARHDRSHGDLVFFCTKFIVQRTVFDAGSSHNLPPTTQQHTHFRSFHSRIGRHLTGRHIRLLEDGSWFCPPTVEVLEDAGLQTIDEYINRRRQTVRGFTMHRPLCEACRRLTALSTNINKAVWWQLEV